MKKIGIITLCATCAILLASCSKDYKAFVGYWGVEKIEYYNIDYAGNPILATLETYNYDPEDIDNGIQLVFRDDKTGEMRDNDIDTVWTDWNDATQHYDSYIVNPDTTLVYTFTYTYAKNEPALYLTIKYTYPYTYMRTHKMQIHDLTSNSFSYEDEYDADYVEHAYLKRLSNTPPKSTNRNKPERPRKPGSFLSNK